MGCSHWFQQEPPRLVMLALYSLAKSFSGWGLWKPGSLNKMSAWRSFHLAEGLGFWTSKARKKTAPSSALFCLSSPWGPLSQWKSKRRKGKSEDNRGECSRTPPQASDLCIGQPARQGAAASALVVGPTDVFAASRAQDRPTRP